MASWNGGSPTPVFNNAAQVWNHTFFWEGMSPNGGGAPSGALATAIDAAFGSFDEFKTQFAAAGATQFGSGWAWLVASSDGSVEIVKTPNAVCPMVEGALTCCLSGCCRCLSPPVSYCQGCCWDWILKGIPFCLWASCLMAVGCHGLHCLYVCTYIVPVGMKQCLWVGNSVIGCTV